MKMSTPKGLGFMALAMSLMFVGGCDMELPWLKKTEEPKVTKPKSDMEQAVSHARQSLTFFVRSVRKQEANAYFVCVLQADTKTGIHRLTWMRDVKVDASNNFSAHDTKTKKRVKFNRRQIVDWAVKADSKVVGDFTQTLQLNP